MASLLGRPPFDESLGIQPRSNQLTGWTPQRHPRLFLSDWRLNFWVAMTACGTERRNVMSALTNRTRSSQQLLVESGIVLCVRAAAYALIAVELVRRSQRREVLQADVPTRADVQFSGVNADGILREAVRNGFRDELEARAVR